VIRKLEERNKTPKSLINSLDNIRSNYRNPTQHPELIYRKKEAQDLFYLCIGATNKIIQNIK